MVSGGTVVDPETQLFAKRNVGIRGGRICSVTEQPLTGNRIIDATGCVVAPGFIDLHSHAQTATGLRLQALDGVTTALELESGTFPVSRTYHRVALEGRPINYGYSVSWALARMMVLDGIPLNGEFDSFAANQGAPKWRAPASRREVNRILTCLRDGIADGAVGIGVLLGYAPETSRSEYLAVASLAAELGVPVFTHARFMSVSEPRTSLEAALEVIAVAAGTGAHMHLCHLNSTSNRSIDSIADAIERARRYGLRLTTEAYPYGSASTVVSAPFLHPDALERIGIAPENILYLPTGERIAATSRLAQLRAENPSGRVIVDWLDLNNSADLAVLQRSLLLADTAIASDAMPLTLRGMTIRDNPWPVPPGAVAHPRTVNCYARTLRWLVNDLGILSLPEAIRRSSLLPATILGDIVPAMRRKGRVQVGADADLIVFDPTTIADRATYTEVVPTSGFSYVIVNGELVVEDSTLNIDTMPGKPVIGEPRDR